MAGENTAWFFPFARGRSRCVDIAADCGALGLKQRFDLSTQEVVSSTGRCDEIGTIGQISLERRMVNVGYPAPPIPRRHHVTVVAQNAHAKSVIIMGGSSGDGKTAITRGIRL